MFRRIGRLYRNPSVRRRGIVLRRNDEGVRRRKRMSVPENAWSAARRWPGRVSVCHARWNVSRKIAVSHRYSCRLVLFGTYTRGYRRNTWKNSAPKTILHDFDPKPAGVNPYLSRQVFWLVSSAAPSQRYSQWQRVREVARLGAETHSSRYCRRFSRHSLLIGLEKWLQVRTLRVQRYCFSGIIRKRNRK